MAQKLWNTSIFVFRDFVNLDFNEKRLHWASVVRAWNLLRLVFRFWPKINNSNENYCVLSNTYCHRGAQCVELKLRWRFCLHTSTCPEIYFWSKFCIIFDISNTKSLLRLAQKHICNIIEEIVFSNCTFLLFSKAISSNMLLSKS